MSTPMLVEFVTAPTDAWLRAEIRGDGPLPVRIHRVIVESAAEADRLVLRLARRKYDTRQPYAGSSIQRLDAAIARLQRTHDPAVATLQDCVHRLVGTV